MREMLLDMSKANYKALCHFAGADLKQTPKGQEVSCLCVQEGTEASLESRSWPKR